MSTDVVADSLMLLELQGIATLDMRNGSAQPRLNNDAVINGTRTIASLLANGEGATLTDVTEPEIAATQRFLDGKALMLLTDQWNPLRVTDIPIRVVALTTQPTPINAVTTTSLHISATSAHADACWQWIRFLTTHNPRITMPFPALSAAVAELDAPLQQIWKTFHPSSAQVSLNTQSLSRGAESQGFAQALLKIMHGQNALAALNDAQSQTEMYFSCLAEGKSLAECQQAFE